MPNFSVNDIHRVFVGAAATMTTTTIAAMNDGEIACFTPGGVRLTEASAATATSFVIVQKRGSTEAPIISDPIKVADIVDAKCKRKVYSAATEQIDYIGFNGTSGSIEEINDNLYYVRLNINQALKSNHGGLYVKRGTWKSPVTGTNQNDIADGIAVSLYQEFLKENEDQIKIDRLINHAGAAVGAAADTVVGSKGSRSIVITDTGGDASVIALSAGDYIRLGTAVTSVVYKITASTVTTGGGTLTLDIPLQEAVSLAGNAAEYITEAQAEASDCGIKLTGVALTFRLGKIHYRKMRWKTTVENFGTTVITESQAATEGTGTYEQMAELEWFSQSLEGDFYLTPEPFVYAKRAEATSTAGYDQIDIFVESQDRSSLVSTNAPRQYTILVPATAPNWAVTGTANDTTDVLEVLVFGTANGNFATT